VIGVITGGFGGFLGHVLALLGLAVVLGPRAVIDLRGGIDPNLAWAAAASLAGGVLGRIMAPGRSQITPDQASKLTPQQVQDVVEHAHQTNPGIADELAGFYALHSGLIKTLGGAALAIAMAKMKDHLSQS
jgi:hypothetical protein